MKTETMAYYETSLGGIEIVCSELGIVSLRFVISCDVIGESKPSLLSDDAFRQVSEYLGGDRTSFELPLDLVGTPFQLKVWTILQSIPYGEIMSYKEVALLVGNAKASRAVGMANNRNKVLMLIPCHRVVGVDGRLVGYAGGLERKKALLQLEGVLPYGLG